MFASLSGAVRKVLPRAYAYYNIRELPSWFYPMVWHRYNSFGSSYKMEGLLLFELFALFLLLLL